MASRPVDFVATTFKVRKKIKSIVTISVVVVQQIEELCNDIMRIRRGLLA